MTAAPGVVAAVFVALFAAHQVADHWVQTGHQTAHKGEPGWRGWSANLAHVATYTATAALFLAAIMWRCGLELDGWRVAAALAVSAVTHAWADRRHTLAWLAGLLGHSGFYRLGQQRPGRDDNPSLGTGAYALDQSWHVGWLFVAALIAA